MKPSGIREPHWHPNASELGYILEGSARLIVLSPGSSIDTFEVGPGEIYFIPTGFFPYIENLDSSENIIPCNALLPLSKVSQQLKKWTYF